MVRSNQFFGLSYFSCYICPECSMYGKLTCFLVGRGNCVLAGNGTVYESELQPIQFMWISWKKTPPNFNSSPLKIYRNPKGKRASSNHPFFYRASCETSRMYRASADILMFQEFQLHHIFGIQQVWLKLFHWTTLLACYKYMPYPRSSSNSSNSLRWCITCNIPRATHLILIIIIIIIIILS